jgi:hypothetical protein
MINLEKTRVCKKQVKISPATSTNKEKENH